MIDSSPEYTSGEVAILKTNISVSTKPLRWQNNCRFAAVEQRRNQTQNQSSSDRVRTILPQVNELYYSLHNINVLRKCSV